jgi:hypothetical protein
MANGTSLDSAAQNTPVGSAFRSPARIAFLRTLVLVFLFATAAVYEAFSLSALSGLNVWSHLRTGIWILQNHGVPHSGLFSLYPDVPWIAHGWAFDLVLATAYKALGLRALPVLLMVFKVALALTLFWLARGSRQIFWIPVLLAGVAQYALPALQLEPTLCSILLCAITLAILFHVRRKGDAHSLFWLPLLFAVWANFDTQFVYGLVALVLLLAVVVVEAIFRRCGVLWFAGQPAISLGMMAGLAAASLLATLLTPYTYEMYGVALKIFSRSVLLPYLPELNAIRFRRPQDYALLLLTMVAFFSLGRRRSRDIFAFALIVVASIFSFPTQRHSWLVVVTSVAVIGQALSAAPAESVRESVRLWRLENLVTAGLVLLALLVAVITRVPARYDALLAKVGRTLPVKACNYIRDQHLPGPLFNSYDWGGFLTWYLPEFEVVIDARNDLFGDEINLRYFKITHGEIPLSGDFHFVYARTILLERDAPMAVALSATPQFKAVYRDDLTMVLIPQN